MRSLHAASCFGEQLPSPYFAPPCPRPVPPRSYRQRITPDQRRRERRRLRREQADHLQTLEQLGQGIKQPLRPGRGAAAGGAAREAPPPRFTLAPVFHGGADADAHSTQLVPLHRRRPPAAAAAGGAALPSAAEPAAAAAAAPPSSAGSASMRSAASRLGEHEPAGGSGSCAASGVPLLPQVCRGSAAAGGSAASAAASTLAYAASSAAPSFAGASGSAACQADLIELELVDAAGACLERLPPQPQPQPQPLPDGGRGPRASPDTEAAVHAQPTPSFLAFVVGTSQMGSLEGGSSGSSGAARLGSTAASRPHPPAPGAASPAPASGAGASHSASAGGSAAQEAGLPAVSSQAALLEGRNAWSGSPGRSGSSRRAGSAAAASPAAGSAGALLSSFKRVLHGRLQQLSAPHSQVAAKPVAGGRRVPAAATAADAEDVLPVCPARAAAAPSQCSADENSPMLA